MAVVTMDYNGYSLQSSTVVTSKTTLLSPPSIDVQVADIAHTDGGVVVQQYFASKTFTIDGYIKGTDINDMLSKIDAFKLALAQANGILGFTVDSTPRRLVYCTARQIQIQNDGVHTIAGFTVTFISADGMIWDTVSTVLLSQTLTGNSTSIPVTVFGSYRAQPYFRYTLNSVNVTGPQTVSIINGATQLGITVMRTWSANDVLEIDNLAQSVYVNGIPIDFLGNFISLAPGSGSVIVNDTFTSRNASLIGTYTVRWQ